MTPQPGSIERRGVQRGSVRRGVLGAVAARAAAGSRGQERPLARVVGLAVGRAVLVVVALALIGSFSPRQTSAVRQDRPQASDPVPSQARSAPDAGRVRALLASHGCWSGAAPAGAVAASVVLTRTVHGGSGDVQVTSFTRDRHVVELALDQAVWGRPHGLTVHGFCT
jgi:hypothetical protein